MIVHVFILNKYKHTKQKTKCIKNDLSNLPLMPKFHVDNIEAESFYILLDHWIWVWNDRLRLRYMHDKKIKKRIPLILVHRLNSTDLLIVEI